MRRLRGWGAAAAKGATALSWVPTGALVVLFVTVFFSIALQQVAAVLGWVSALAGGAAHDRDGRVPAPKGLVIPLALLVAVSTLSACFSVAPVQGWRILATEILAMGLAVAGARVVSGAQARAAVTSFLVMAAAAGAWSIYQFAFEFEGVIDFGHRAHGFWHAGAFVSYGNVLAMAFALALGVGLWGRQARRLACVSAAMAVVGMGMSYTRASWLASAAVVAVASIWRRAVGAFVVLVLLAGAILVLPAHKDSQELLARARSVFDLTAGSNLDRIVRYRIGAAVISDYPLLGTGPGGLKVVYPRYAQPGARDNWHLHNTYLQLLAERGPLGLGAWLLAIVWGIVRAFRTAARGEPGRGDVAAGIGLLLTALLFVAIFNYVWEDWRVRSLGLAFLGLAWSPAIAGRHTRATSDEVGHRAAGEESYTTERGSGPLAAAAPPSRGERVGVADGRYGPGK
jgi:O-antigen ligase